MPKCCQAAQPNFQVRSLKVNEGKPRNPTLDEFLEILQTAFTPDPQPKICNETF